MILSVDIGNARIKAGVYYRGSILHAWAGPSTPAGAAACATRFARIPGLRGAGVVSVVPKITGVLANALKARLKGPVWIISPSSSKAMKVEYSPVSRLGGDRYVNAAGAAARYGTPVIVVDVGTAVTIDAVRPGPRFVGGVILPGPDLMGRSLANGTAKLPVVSLAGKSKVFGTSTQAAIRGGIGAGLAGGIVSIVDRMKRSLGPKTRVVLTGGGSRWLRSQGGVQGTWDPQLTLKAVWWLTDQHLKKA